MPCRELQHDMRQHPNWVENFGVINVDIEAELAKLTGGRRPLRSAQLRDLGL